MGMVGNVAKDHAGEQLHDDIAMRGRLEVEEGMAALRGPRADVPGMGRGVGGTEAGGYGTGVGDHSQAGYSAGRGTGVGERLGKHDITPAAGYGSNTYPAAASGNDAGSHHEGGFIRPGANAVNDQYRGQEKSQATGGSTEHPYNMQHTAAAPPLPSRPEEPDFQGSRVSQTGQSQALPPPGVHHTTEARPGVHPQEDIYDGRYYVGEDAAGSGRGA